jgi:hypothetical protein
MAVEYLIDSPYSLTSMRGDYLDVYEPRTFPAYADDVLFTITQTYHRRPDLLAYDLYKNANLWWVFMIRNPNEFNDPIWDFKAGKKIFIPKQDTLTSSLGL